MEAVIKAEQKHYKLTRMINTMLLITHVCLLSLFAFLKINLMAYVNVVSVALYVILFFTYKRSLVRYVFVVYLEVLIHMALATISVGWDGGFQLYSFCLIPCAFLCDYLSKTDGGKTMHPIVISTCTVALYLATRIFCEMKSSIYVLSSSGQYTFMFVYNAILSFAFLMVYMSVFGNRILSKEKQLASMAELDELTQLPNRYLMHEWLSEEFNKSNVAESKVAVAILDIDDFKHLNDTYGHECGDIVLKEIAGDINRVSDEHLKVCRWGGEEFLFMCSGKEAYERMNNKLEELRKNIEKKSILFQNKAVSVTVTVGTAEYNEEDGSFHDIIRRADERLYRGKENGKNCIVGKEAM